MYKYTSCDIYLLEWDHLEMNYDIPPLEASETMNSYVDIHFFTSHIAPIKFTPCILIFHIFLASIKNY